MVVFCKCVHLQSISFQKNQMHQMPSLHYDINVSNILLLLIINVSCHVYKYGSPMYSNQLNIPSHIQRLLSSLQFTISSLVFSLSPKMKFGAKVIQPRSKAQHLIYWFLKRENNILQLQNQDICVGYVCILMCLLCVAWVNFVCIIQIIHIIRSHVQNGRLLHCFDDMYW